MENICEVKNIDGEEWVVFNDSFNEKISPHILDLISRYNPTGKSSFFAKIFNTSGV